ncbi:uncharacterized protein LOC124916287 [Impatiens glandulifera]|uniref:uncharacterized protein LOC124916287 n=1 Tax=Impatiens glandulifera TaxID=253017 RepID=UPI001FB0AB84|nr:uncharacterized protein LOC124916287 [Impatiens glandulifera]
MKENPQSTLVYFNSKPPLSVSINSIHRNLQASNSTPLSKPDISTMKDQSIILKEDVSVDDYSDLLTVAPFCWWRSAAKFEEYLKWKEEEAKSPSLNPFKLDPELTFMREMERLALLSPEGLDELRQKLYAYRAGDFWVPAGGVKREDMDIPPVNTILLVGFHNSGKSSLVNLMYSVLGRTGVIPFAQTLSGNGSRQMAPTLEEHNVLRSMRSGFCVYDSAGFDYDEVNEFTGEMWDWMIDGVYHREPLKKLEDESHNRHHPWKKMESDFNISLTSSTPKFAKRRVTFVMVVANLFEINKAIKSGDRQPLEAVRQIFCSPAIRKCNENPLLILTHGDEVGCEDRINARLKICDYLEISEATGVYDIVCLTEYGFLPDESDLITAYSVTEAIYRSLMVADRGHLPKRKIKDKMILVLAWFMGLLGAFFGLLARSFSALSSRY